MAEMVYTITVNAGGETAIYEAEGKEEFNKVMKDLFKEKWRVATVFKFNGDKGYRRATFIKGIESNWMLLK